jgi:hypothetical protein
VRCDEAIAAIRTGFRGGIILRMKPRKDAQALPLWCARPGGVNRLQREVCEKPRIGLCCSRSFGGPATVINDLCAALAIHCARGDGKLSRQRMAASHLAVIISTSRFRQNKFTS